MKRLTTALLLQTALLITLTAPMTAAKDGAKQPPVAKKMTHSTEIHGYTMKDDYFWLRGKENPEVIKYLEDENAYTEEVMQPTKGLQDALYKEILGHIKQTDLSVPSRIGDYYYYSRTEEGKQYPIQCRRKGTMEAPEEVLLDLNELGQGKPYIAVGHYRISDDGKRLAYSIDWTGYRQYEVFVMDLATRHLVPLAKKFAISESDQRFRSPEWVGLR